RHQGAGGNRPSRGSPASSRTTAGSSGSTSLRSAGPPSTPVTRKLCLPRYSTSKWRWAASSSTTTICGRRSVIRTSPGEHATQGLPTFCGSTRSRSDGRRYYFATLPYSVRPPPCDGGRRRFAPPELQHRRSQRNLGGLGEGGQI